MRMTQEQLDELTKKRQAKPQATKPRQRPKVSGRQRPEAQRMNKTESAYFHECLQPRLADGSALDVKFEGLKLRLATKTFYTPDFIVTTPDGIEVHEVKGHWEDDARVKIKVAADQFWWMSFRAIQRRQGGWKTEVIS